MADRLLIDAIEAQCRVGVTAQERAEPQALWIDIAVPVDAARAAKEDRVEASVDYAKLVERVRAVCASQEFQLIETVAERVAEMLLWEARAKPVRVRVKKRALPGIGYAAVEIERR